jgi:hypothetical protein
LALPGLRCTQIIVRIVGIDLPAGALRPERVLIAGKAVLKT